MKQKTRSRKHFILKAEIPGMGYLIERIIIIVIVMVIVIALVIVIVIVIMKIRVSLIVLVILTTRCVHTFVRK